MNNQNDDRQQQARIRHKRWRDANPEKMRAIRQRYEAKHPRVWTEAQREAARARARKQKLAQRQFVTPEELAACRSDPETAFTIRGNQWIICVECGQMLKAIRARGRGAHLVEHGISKERYRIGPDPANPRYGKNRGLICNDLKAKKRDEARCTTKLVPDHNRRNLTSPRKGRKMPPEFSRKLANRMRGQRNEDWIKDIADIEFVWPWAIEERSLEDVSKIVCKLSPDGKFSSGGIWVRLKTIIGKPVRRSLKSEPALQIAERTAKILQECGADDAKLKTEITKLCEESRREVAEENKRGNSAIAMLLMPRMRAWQRQNPDVLSPAGLARRFLADRAWISVRQHRKKNATRPKARSIREPKGVEKTSKYKLAKALSDLLPRCQQAIQNIRASKRTLPGDRKRCESEARNVGFADQAQVDILIESKTPEAAAAKIIAIRKGLTPRAVQNAWSVHRNLFQ